MNVDLWLIPVILVVGLVAGFMNTVAGGGSLLTLPLLIFLGLPSAVANGTNRVAIEIQNILAVMGFRSKGVSDFKFSIQLSIPALIGSYLGARIAIDINETLFNRLLAGIMILVLGLILWNPTAKLRGSDQPLSTRRRVATIIAAFFVGIYGGFIQAGVGFLWIGVLVGITGLDLVKVNAHKVFIIMVYTLLTLWVFASEGKVDWIIGLSLAVGNGAGGWIAGRVAASTGERFVRPVLVVTILIMAVRLSGIIPGW